MCGVFNNFSYVVMLAAAKHILADSLVSYVLLFADCPAVVAQVTVRRAPLALAAAPALCTAHAVVLVARNAFCCSPIAGPRATHQRASPADQPD